MKLHDLDEAGYGVDELRAALRDFRRAHKRHENHPKAKHAMDRVRKGLGHWTPSNLLEQYGPAIVALLALVLFVVTQIAFWAPPATLHMRTPYYFTLSVGALLLLIAGIYLPKVLKLKVAGIELEKAGIDQLSVRSLGLKLKRTERRGFPARSTPSFTSRATSLRESMKAGGRQQSIKQPTLTRPQPLGVPEIHGG